jgi:hypothetical protein
VFVDESAQHPEGLASRLRFPARRPDCHQTVKDETAVTTPPDEFIEFARRTSRLGLLTRGIDLHEDPWRNSRGALGYFVDHRGPVDALPDVDNVDQRLHFVRLHVPNEVDGHGTLADCVLANELLGVVLADAVTSRITRRIPCVMAERLRDGDQRDADAPCTRNTFANLGDTRRYVDGRHAVTATTT